ncbi:hypothetical protein IEQ34_003403 [Dendrobium chrysotoxum]|uniref:Bidirectional sugar transporter SWEET n=1 Tax=Dendrobium chrysotoxum TaxID=161865 RepID=A0AAV7HJM2_DENCH|nr:hypothetical protein IEQ34_003403 [Dendrobium chrysotoxum]
MPFVKPNSTLIVTINGAGTVIELLYIFIYLVYSDKLRQINALLLLFTDIAFIAVVAAIVLSIFKSHERRTLIIGILCIIFCIMTYASPLSIMIPNAIGLLFFMAQLLLHAIYNKSTKRQSNDGKREVALSDVNIPSTSINMPRATVIANLNSRTANRKLSVTVGISGGWYPPETSDAITGGFVTGNCETKFLVDYPSLIYRRIIRRNYAGKVSFADAISAGNYRRSYRRIVRRLT